MQLGQVQRFPRQLHTSAITNQSRRESPQSGPLAIAQTTAQKHSGGGLRVRLPSRVSALWVIGLLR